MRPCLWFSFGQVLSCLHNTPSNPVIMAIDLANCSLDSILRVLCANHFQFAGRRRRHGQSGPAIVLSTIVEVGTGSWREGGEPGLGINTIRRATGASGSCLARHSARVFRIFRVVVQAAACHFLHSVTYKGSGGLDSCPLYNHWISSVYRYAGS